MTDEDAEVEVRWAKGSQFAEVAEALRIRTDQIMSYGKMPDCDFMVSLYTPDDDPWLWSAKLERDSDGILRATEQQRFMSVADFEKELNAGVEQRLKEIG